MISWMKAMAAVLSLILMTASPLALAKQDYKDGKKSKIEKTYKKDKKDKDKKNKKTDTLDDDNEEKLTGIDKQRIKKAEQERKELDKGSEKGIESREVHSKKWWKFWE